jgi:hypothetical protein
VKKLQNKGMIFLEPCYSFLLFLNFNNKEGGKREKSNLLTTLLTSLSLWSRFSGTVVGTEDADPIRWPGSKWRCLKVLYYGA